MRVIKPLRASFVHRVFDHRKKHVVVMTVAYCFPFGKPDAPVTEPEMWKTAGAAMGRFGVLDHWMFKPQGEVLVTGSCFTGERSKGSEFVRFTVGREEKRTIDKKLYVFGDRKWTLIGPSEPQMFSKMPIDYAHAYGGEKYPENPIGKGLVSVTEESGVESHPLPNIEDPKKQIKSKGDRPSPASFAPWDLTWPFHFEKKMGTYDFDWVQKNGFALADDMDFSLFNVAATDQRVEGYWTGDETIRIENMHPDHRMLETSLPGFGARVFYRKTIEADPERKLREVPLRIDTIHLFPAEQRGIVFFRGVTEIGTSDASDIELAMATLEDGPGKERPLSHFELVLAQRLDKEKGALYALRDRDLMPPSAKVDNSAGLSVGDPLEDALKRDGLIEGNQYRRAMKLYDENKERLLSMGVDPTLIPAPPPPPKPANQNLETIPELVAELEDERDRMLADAKKKRDEAESFLEQLCKEHDIDKAALIEQQRREGAGPPKFSAEGEMSRLSDVALLMSNAGTPNKELEAQLVDPNFRTRLLEAEQRLTQVYRIGAHHQDAPAPMEKDATQRARDELVVILRGAPPGRRDFTGADLSGMDLTGIDLEGAFFEGANLRGVNLKGARLKDVVFARADLEGANLENADMRRVNLGKATLRGANLSGADLSDSVLYEASLDGARLVGARLDRAQTMMMSCAGTDMSKAQATNLFIHKSNLRGAVLRGARFSLCVFHECEGNGLDARGSDMSQSVFLKSNCDEANFSDSILDNFRIVLSSFERSNFKDARMAGSNLRGAKLTGSDFTNVMLKRSDLSSADFRKADLSGMIAPESLMLDTNFENAKLVGANLMMTIMHRAILRNADVSKANLFCADLTGAIGNDKTSFSGSNVKRALVAGVYHG